MYACAMAPPHAAASRARYQPRPGRTPLVTADLADPDRTFDLSDPDMLRSMYEKVLREAIRTDELTRFLNGGTLVAVWRDLFLPRAVRQAWEDRHPVLRRAAAAA
jgi:hypothetical protein